MSLLQYLFGNRDFIGRQFKETSGRRETKDEEMLYEKKRGQKIVAVSRPFEQSGQSKETRDPADLIATNRDFRERGRRQRGEIRSIGRFKRG